MSGMKAFVVYKLPLKEKIMARKYSVTWQEGNFRGTAVVLSFNSKAARSAYPMQARQRVGEITAKAAYGLRKKGHTEVLMLWDRTQPTKFVMVQA